VRIWDHDPVTIARVLDAGAWGVVVPHVSNPEQAEKLAQATRYPPRGARSVGTGRCVTLNGYREWIDDEVLCIPQIEDLEGIEKAEQIASVEGINIGFLGPGDLALSMGVEVGHPDHEAALQRFRAGCQRAGKPCGIPTRDAASTKERIAQGFNFIDLSNDLRFLETTATQVLADARS
jgi:2-keto-3-deoxy-L-rhamnonate aldolase RhmA